MLVSTISFKSQHYLENFSAFANFDQVADDFSSYFESLESADLI